MNEYECLSSSFEMIERLNNEMKHPVKTRMDRLAELLRQILLPIFCPQRFFHQKHVQYVAKKHNRSKQETSYQYGEYPSLSKRFLVYTCVTKGYDRPAPAYLSLPNVDYVIFTDDDDLEIGGWSRRALPKEVRHYHNGTLINRYLKLHPHIVGKDYDYTLYIDGNVEVISNITNMINAINPSYGIAMHNHPERDCIYDEVEICKAMHKGKLAAMRRQVEQYKQLGFPKHYGLIECTIILTDMSRPIAKQICEAWWREFYSSESMRDQLALPYIIWKMKIETKELATLGNNVKQNPKFRIGVHDIKCYKY